MKALRFFFALLLVLSIVAIPFSVFRLWSAQSAYQSAGRQLNECKQLSARIKQLQTEPELVSLVKRSENQIREDIVRASNTCELPITRISPPVSKQIPNSPYIEQSTSIDTSAVELTQLFRFLKELTAGDEKHDIASIRLTEPNTSNADASKVEKWSAELSITSWTYAQK